MTPDEAKSEVAKHRLIYDQQKVFAKDNLARCCHEICRWRKTGILETGLVRQIADQLNSIDDMPVRLAEQMIVQLAIESIAEQSK